MNNSTYRFTLDLQKHQSQMSIAVFQYDTSVRLYISLTDGGNPYYIEDGVRAVLYGKKPNDEPLVQNCAIEGNTRIVYDFNHKTSDEEGVINCQIRLYKEKDQIITAPRFIIVVGERLVKDEDIVFSDKPLSAFGLSALDKIFTSETAREGAEDDRDEAETARDTAEKARAEAETAREGAEAERAEAETARDTAEKARAYAENGRKATLETMRTEIREFTNEANERLSNQDKLISTDVTERLDAQDEKLEGVGTALDSIIKMQDKLLTLEAPSVEILRLGD